jgi:amino acid adenylation domain-containing protein
LSNKALTTERAQFATVSNAKDDRSRRLVGFPRSEVDQSIISRFETIASSLASSVAIRSRNGQITYDALNRASNRFARVLATRRGTIAEPVGLLLEQDDRTISALMGVLKAGKFYVPLDPSYPPDRLSFILRDCQSRVVVTDRKHLSLAHALAPSECSVIELDDVADDNRTGNPGLSVSPHAVAALFYTSGSTGRPKGVIQTHRLVLHRVMIDTNGLGICPEDRLSLLTSPSYSSSLRHLFGALLNGAAVCPFNLVEQGLTELVAWLRRERISIYASVPAVFRQLIESLDGTQVLDTIRVVHLGGETVTSADFDLYCKHFSSGCKFVTSLSSNETGQVARYFADKTTHMTDRVVPVGYAVDDKEIIVVDEGGRALGPNQVGEITVRSEFLSPGYWGRPDLTAAAFRQDPSDPGKRIYHTGDLGMLSSDGCLIFKGRKDSRVKIRGIRVEIEEIDAALHSHPEIDRSVVVARENEPGQHALVAYIVTRPGVRLSAADIRRFLTLKVPDCMVPSAFVFLDRLPLTPNGKIDTRALPSPDTSRPQVDTQHVAARDAFERELTRICESIIGIQPIGTRDNLFDLGVDSLTLLRITARIAGTFGKHLPPATLFNSPTIADLAAILRSESFPGRWSSLIPVQPLGTRPPFFWVHGDSSTMFLSRVLGPDQPFYGLEHQSQDGTPARYTEVETIAAYYLNEIRTVQSEGPYFLGGYSFGALVGLELAQQLAKQGERVGLLVLLDPPSLAAYQRADSSASAVSEETDHSSFADWLRRQMQHLSTLTLKEKVGHIISRGMDRAADKLGLWTAARFAKTVIYRAALASSVRLPVLVRSVYIQDIYRSAGRRYAPRHYAQPVLLFKGERRRYRPQSDWEQLLAGDCHVHLVKADHQQLREEKYVHLWADTLKRVLSNAQAQTTLQSPGATVGRRRT